MTYSEHELEFTFAKKIKRFLSYSRMVIDNVTVELVVELAGFHVLLDTTGHFGHEPLQAIETGEQMHLKHTKTQETCPSQWCSRGGRRKRRSPKYFWETPPNDTRTRGTAATLAFHQV